MSAGKPHIYTEPELQSMIAARADQERSRAAQELQDGVYRLLKDIEQMPAEVASGAICRALKAWRFGSY